MYIRGLISRNFVELAKAFWLIYTKNKEECSGSVVECLTWDRDVAKLVGALLDALYCVLEQNTLSSDLYWFNPGTSRGSAVAQW